MNAQQQPSHHVDAFLSGETSAAWFRGAVKVPSSDTIKPAVVFPGSFNPLHAGHLEMAVLAERKLGQPVHYELSIRNVDKSDLPRMDIIARLQQFSSHNLVVVTRAKTFAEKAKLFPQATFVVGADTMRRIADPGYYSGAQRQMLDAIQQIEDAGCRFLVFGRLLEGAFRELSHLGIPTALRRLCHGVDETQFRRDISSTQLRDRSNET